MNRLPNRIREKINIEKMWKESLRKQLNDLYYESEKYDSILHNKLEVLINQVDDLISLKNTQQDYVDEKTLKDLEEIENFEIYSKFDEKKELVKNYIVEIVKVVSMKTYNTQHIQNAPESFKEQVSKIIVPLDEFFESISYMKKEREELEVSKSLPRDKESNVKHQYEREFKMNKEE